MTMIFRKPIEGIERPQMPADRRLRRRGLDINARFDQMGRVLLLDVGNERFTNIATQRP